MEWGVQDIPVERCTNERGSHPGDARRSAVRAVEVIMYSGERHLVKHPEFAILLPSRLIVTDPIADRAAMLSLIHITELRPVQPQRSA